MAEIPTYAKQLIDLMDEFGLSSAELATDNVTVRLKRSTDGVTEAEPASANLAREPRRRRVAKTSGSGDVGPQAPAGMPVSSPMTGIYYGSPSPQSAPFVQEGQTVEAGQTIALIEAMKVFNEIPAPMSGTVTKVVASNGQLVQPGEPLIFIGS